MVMLIRFSSTVPIIKLNQIESLTQVHRLVCVCMPLRLCACMCECMFVSLCVSMFIFVYVMCE